MSFADLLSRMNTKLKCRLLNIKQTEREKALNFDHNGSGCPEFSLESNYSFLDELYGQNISREEASVNEISNTSELLDKSEIMEDIIKAESMVDIKFGKNLENVVNDDYLAEPQMLDLIIFELDKIRDFLKEVKTLTGIILS